MKLVTSLLLLLFTYTAFAQDDKGRGVIKTKIYCNHCKACGSCGKLFQKNMYKIKGLKHYELDEPTQTFIVYYNPKKTNIETIRIEIAKLGYAADDVKPNEVAFSQLEKCCKPK